MGYDLIAKKKDAEDLSIGAFSWPHMLQETGMGYVLGYGANFKPGTYVYQSGRKGSPSSNDGYRVTSFEAKAMAAVARGYVSVNRFINKQYEEMPEDERKGYENALYHGDEGIVRKLYLQPVSEDYLKKLEKFADFAEKSGGFEIH
ncbi:hypothetical protein RG089_000597 [Elizabethkingia anophelis]|nr:hypothetical protein [Elizabethkingia anophelis]ELB1892029.1 hypothetical protein [Elizabethkingia anophelis]